MFKFLKNIRRNEEGATAIEYGLIAALIAIALIGTLTSVGGSLTTLFGTVETELTTANTTATSGGGGAGAGAGGGTE